ncbi:MAG: hypothetical protein ACUVSL_04485, partial [Chloroflexus sp.]|uniref:hypothetical protein n=1 Tax=Chloroflexus sp. TaxID=1904827 RepID=UPI00404A0982
APARSHLTPTVLTPPGRLSECPLCVAAMFSSTIPPTSQATDHLSPLVEAVIRRYYSTNRQ